MVTKLQHCTNAVVVTYGRNASLYQNGVLITSLQVKFFLFTPRDLGTQSHSHLLKDSGVDHCLLVPLGKSLFWTM